MLASINTRTLTKIPLPDIQLTAGGLHLQLDGGELTLSDAERGHRLVVMPVAGYMMPWLDGHACKDVVVRGVTADGDGIVIEQEAAGCRVRASWRLADGHIELSASITVTSACQLNRLDLLPTGTQLNLWDVVNYRNAHDGPTAWPELLVRGKSFATDTASGDWQFAPHPSVMVLRRGSDQLLLGALDLPSSFGLHLAAERHRLRHCHLDYGAHPHGLALAAGTVFTTPRFALLLDRTGDVASVMGRWTSLLVAQGTIPDPKSVVRHAWHREPVYCTWIDQCARADFNPPPDLADQAEAAGPALRVLNQDLVREALHLIRNEGLPFRTILIDDGWQIGRGDWRAHPTRFPDLRGLVDEIHAAGLKAIAWWAWPEIGKEVVVDPALLVAGGRLNRHSARMYDYASRTVQQAYLEPLIRRLISSEPGCYDFDGVKTDFVADKVHADMPPGALAWRGEEVFFYRFYSLLLDLMTAHKPDACHIGCSGHPWLAHLISINRTFDVFGADVRMHAVRGDMLEATSPGTPIALDFHLYRECLDEWFALGHSRGWSFQVGNLLGMRRDPLAPWQPADADYLEQVRQGLKQMQR